MNNVDASPRDYIIEAIVDQMMDHVKSGDDFSLKDMSQAVYLSQFYLSRIFKTKTGISLGKLLSALRMNVAKGLLIHSDFSVTDICHEVGYNSLPTFTLRFTELVTINPTEFRSLVNNRINHVPNIIDMHHNRVEHGGRLSGTISSDHSFSGYIFIGLFTSPLPAGRPKKCTVIADHSKHFSISGIEPGIYYVKAVVIGKEDTIQMAMHPNDALRGGTDQPLLIEGSGTKTIHIKLRKPRKVDPPILLALPSLLMDHSDRSS